MYTFLQHNSGASGNIILGTLLFIVAFIMYLKAVREDVNYTVRTLLALAMIGSLIIPLIGLLQLRDEGISKSLTIEQAYIVEKEGDLIQFKRSLRNDALKDEVTVHVLSETKDQYQVEYKGQYYRINKSDVQKGN